MYSIASSVIALATIVVPLSGQAEIRSTAKDIVVVETRDLPEQAQTGESLLLHSDQGSNYVYIEQQEGARLTVLNVTDPSRIKVASSVPLEGRGVFDFVRPVNDRIELIRYRQTGSVAALDLSKASQPTIHEWSQPVNGEWEEPLGETGLLTTANFVTAVQNSARDFEVVDTSRPLSPVTLTNIKGVEHRVSNPDTGTIFLLGSEGLTVIRQIEVENQYRAQETQLQHN
jgi:hypothetical protein